MTLLKRIVTGLAVAGLLGSAFYPVFLNPPIQWIICDHEAQAAPWPDGLFQFSADAIRDAYRSGLVTGLTAGALVGLLCGLIVALLVRR